MEAMEIRISCSENRPLKGSFLPTPVFHFLYSKAVLILSLSRAVSLMKAVAETSEFASKPTFHQLAETPSIAYAQEVPFCLQLGILDWSLYIATLLSSPWDCKHIFCLPTTFQLFPFQLYPFT